MRGRPRNNFPAFDAAAAYINSLSGYVALNPADMDRALGFDEFADEIDVSEEFIQDCMRRDLAAVTEAYACLFIEGWETSIGANTEMWVARACGVETWIAEYDADGNIIGHVTIPGHIGPEFKLAYEVEGIFHDDPSVLAEARRHVYGNPGLDYGHPQEDFTRAAKMWEGILDAEVTPEQVALCMMLLKIARLAGGSESRDPIISIAGYAEVYDQLRNWHVKHPDA